MDTLRGQFGGHDAHGDADQFDDDAAHATPPPAIGADERRMQVRAYNFWASLLDNRNFPSVEELHPEQLPDFGPHGVLLDFSVGIDDPAVAFLGDKLAQECDAGDLVIKRMSDVPSRSLLSRITDHYMQILANQAPIGFEAEFVTPRGTTVLYRGILLPFSSNDETIDFIFGVINWKELADAGTADELLLEIDQALELPRHRPADVPMADWADGPGVAFSTSDVLPTPSFGLLDDDAEPVAASPSEAPESASLADVLAGARALALEARSNEDRTRHALYGAIGRAYDFALAAAAMPQDFAELVADAGLTVQDRAPMTPVVKLVFGAHYDKTRLTEYAAALTHAGRLGLAPGTLAAYLRAAPGGLKGMVAEERRLRRADDADAPASLHNNAFQVLRERAPVRFDMIEREGEEFALIMVRRTGTGDLVVLGEVPSDPQLVERAARRLVA
ncbi:MAG: hypothetical protein ABIT10_04370 [Alteraurantiacibacter sp.]